MWLLWSLLIGGRGLGRAGMVFGILWPILGNDQTLRRSTRKVVVSHICKIEREKSKFCDPCPFLIWGVAWKGCGLPRKLRRGQVVLLSHRARQISHWLCQFAPCYTWEIHLRHTLEEYNTKGWRGRVVVFPRKLGSFAQGPGVLTLTQSKANALTREQAMIIFCRYC